MDDNAQIYARLSTGYKAGGFFSTAPPDGCEPGHLSSYETGTKSFWLPLRLELDAAAFVYDYDYDKVNYLSTLNRVSAGWRMRSPGASGLVAADPADSRVFGLQPAVRSDRRAAPATIYCYFSIS